MTKGLYGQDVQRRNISLPPRYVRDLDALAAKLTGGNGSAMIRRLIDMGVAFWGDGHGRIDSAPPADDGAPTRPQ